jgi:RNA polymerase sigma-70 factor (ECF subfamily)
MLGSLEDAEDILQETLLRAWRRLDSFEGRGPLRAWLYKIATNASLDALERRRARALPVATYPSADPRAALPPPVTESVWLEPLPDGLVDERPDVNPEARYEAHESVSLAFLATLQNLPGRQRAVLILRDVLGWNASQVAQALEMTVVAVNSALQRARSRLKQSGADVSRYAAARDDEGTVSLLARYVAAWEAADSNALIALLREDAVLTMPPLPAWYRGRADIQSFLDTHLFTGQARRPLRLTATRANGSPAFAVYQADEMGVYRPAGLQVLTIQDGQISEINDFLCFDDRLFSRFGLPLVG